MTSTTCSTCANLDIVLDLDHANKNLIEALFVALGRAHDASEKLNHLWIVRSSGRTVFAKLPIIAKLWNLAPKFREITFADELYRGKYAPNSVSQYLRGFYSAYDSCPSIITPNNHAYGPSDIVVVTNRVTSFTEDAFFMGEGVRTNVWASPEQVDAQMAEFFTILTPPIVAEAPSTTPESRGPLLSNKTPVSSKKRKHVEGAVPSAITTTATAMGR